MLKLSRIVQKCMALNLQQNKLMPVCKLAKINKVTFFSTKERSETREVDASKANSQLPDYLLNQLKTAVTSLEVLKIINNHHAIMNSDHILHALRMLFNSQKSGRSHITNTDVLNNPDFAKLCKRLKSESRTLTVSDTLDALKYVTYIGAPGRSVITQVLLQLLRHSVNNLSLQQIVFFDFLISKLDDNPLVQALKIALPIVFENQFTLKLERENTMHLMDMLGYISKKRLPEHLAETTVNLLMDQSSEIDIHSAYSIMRSLIDVRSNSPSVIMLIEKLFVKLNKSLNQLSQEEVTKLLLICSKKYNSDQFYNEDFFNNCCNYVIENNCSLETCISVLNCMTKVNHIHLKLIDYIVSKLIDNPSFLQICQAHHFLSVIFGIANANYIPKDWSKISDSFLQNSFIYNHDKDLPWMRLGLSLAVLDSYPSPLLKYLFSCEFLDKYFSRGINLDHLHLLSLYQAVKTLSSNYTGPFPEEGYLLKALDTNGENVEEFILQGVLERGLGGPAYVQTKVYSKMGHFIDHAVVMRKGGFPAAINLSSNQRINNKTYIEDIVVPPDGQLLLIQVLPESFFAINCDVVRGLHNLPFRSLEALGYSVILISSRSWKELMDHEKIPYVMQKIRLKCESSSLSEKAEF